MKTSSGVRTLEASGLSFSFFFLSCRARRRSCIPPLPVFPIWNESFYFITKFAFAFADPPRGTVGVAFTIDPAHATEVRAYLGT